MNATATQHEWSKYMRFFTENNVGRATRLGVFERTGDAVNDYWLENGLPFVGIDVDAHKDLPSVQISVGELCHDVPHAVDMIFHISASGDEDGVDIKTSNGNTTILRFEKRAG